MWLHRVGVAMEGMQCGYVRMYVVWVCATKSPQTVLGCGYIHNVGVATYCGCGYIRWAWLHNPCNDFILSF